MMKLIVLSAVVAVALGAVTYNSDPRTAQVLRSESDISPDGSYSYGYETENGISAQENGVGGQSVSGTNQYQSPEGEVVQTSYVADENGIQVQGSHIPTPPPTPVAILRALEWNAAHPQTPEPQQQAYRLQ